MKLFGINPALAKGDFYDVEVSPDGTALAAMENLEPLPMDMLPRQVAAPNRRRNLLLVVFLLLTVQSSDVFQYIWGKLLGRHALSKQISPSKTVEGLVGGMLSATAMGAALWWITPFSPGEAAFVALVINTLGFFGGFVLSAIKRDRGVKDWGHLIEGHGGMLDRVDSLAFSAPVFFHLLRHGWTL